MYFIVLFAHVTGVRNLCFSYRHSWCVWAYCIYLNVHCFEHIYIVSLSSLLLLFILALTFIFALTPPKTLGSLNAILSTKWLTIVYNFANAREILSSNFNVIKNSYNSFDYTCGFFYIIVNIYSLRNLLIS